MITKQKIKNKGAAITEAVIIMPVLLIILYGMYHFWRVSIVISDATVAARSELILHPLSINKAGNLNKENWHYAEVGFSQDAQFYSNMGMFPGVAADNIQITSSSQRYDPENGLPIVYDTMRSVMTGSASVKIKVPLPGQPFLHGGRQNQIYTATAICSVNPWALNQGQFFGATLGWIDGMVQQGVSFEKDSQTILRNGVKSLDGLPEE